MKYYGLWYCSDFFGARSAHAISEYPETLMKLHENAVANKKTQWHNFKENVSDIRVEPIECYTYIKELQKIISYHDSHKTDGHAFYAFNPLCGENFEMNFYEDIDMKIIDSGGDLLDSNDYEFDKGEILIYLSKSCKDLWEECNDQYKKAGDLSSNFSMDSKLPIFFYTTWLSDLQVEPDTYYEEGIMNA